MADRNEVPQAYLSLQERLAKWPEGAPDADELFEIFQILFTEEEALVGSKMPMRPTDFEGIVEATGIERDRLAEVLASMADKGLVVDVESKGRMRYVLAPPVIGFLEYTFMKRNEHLPMKRLAELSDVYLTRHLLPKELAQAVTPRARVLPYESAFGEMTSEVVTYERARELIANSGGGALTMCFCRREAHLLGRGCDAPVDDICMGLGRGGDYLVRHGFARPATVDELLAKLDEAETFGLVHTCDNVQDRSVFMCHCCGCCCHLLRAINELNSRSVLAPSRFMAHVDEEACTGCGLCEERCHVAAIAVDDGVSKVNADRCIGCGVCVPECPSEALSLAPRDAAPEPPRNFKDLLIRLAQEKDRLKYFM